MHAFIDEAGDLGFNFAKKGTSKYFIIVAVIIKDVKKFRRIIKKVKTVSLGKKYRKMPEIKFSKSSIKVRERVLREMLKTDFKFIYFVMNKIKIKSSLRNKKDKLYNYVTGLLLDHLLKNNPSNSIHLIVDKVKTKKMAIEDFDNYLDLKTILFGDKVSLNIKHVLSQNDLGLQGIDFITGAIFQAHERENWDYYNVIRGNYQRGIVWPK